MPGVLGQAVGPCLTWLLSYIMILHHIVLVTVAKAGEGTSSLMMVE